MNFFELPEQLGDEEIFTSLLTTPDLVVERIISTGQATPAGEWYDQAWDEWVIVLQGEAGILIEGEKQIRIIKKGDPLFLPAHLRHRVEWTQKAPVTLWLAVHSGKPAEEECLDE